jgi:hypothetical protein
MKKKLDLTIRLHGILLAAFFVWNVVEGAVFENEYPYAMVKLYKYPIWRIAALILVVFAADWSPAIALMLSFSIFFYIMDIEVTREKWSTIDLKRNTKPPTK